MQKGFAAVLGSFIGRRGNDFGKKSRLPAIRFGFRLVSARWRSEDEQDTALRGQAASHRKEGISARASWAALGRGEGERDARAAAWEASFLFFFLFPISFLFCFILFFFQSLFQKGFWGQLNINQIQSPQNKICLSMNAQNHVTKLMINFKFPQKMFICYIKCSLKFLNNSN